MRRGDKNHGEISEPWQMGFLNTQADYLPKPLFRAGDQRVCDRHRSINTAGWLGNCLFGFVNVLLGRLRCWKCKNMFCVCSGVSIMYVIAVS